MAKLDYRKIKKIHTIRRSLGLEDDVYHDLLHSMFGVRSCKELNTRQYLELLEEFKAKGWRPKRKGGKGTYPGRPENMDDPDKGPQLGKVEALLTDMNLPWSYADHIAARICKVEKVKWCRPPELQKVIAALCYQQRRRDG